MEARRRRKQLEDETRSSAGRQNLIRMIADINKKLEDVEYQLITRADALSDDKYFQTAYNLYQNFLWLNGEIGTGAGDVQGSGDWGATETGIGLVLDLEKTLEKFFQDFDISKRTMGNNISDLKIFWVEAGQVNESQRTESVAA